MRNVASAKFLVNSSKEFPNTSSRMCFALLKIPFGSKILVPGYSSKVAKKMKIMGISTILTEYVRKQFDSLTFG